MKARRVVEVQLYSFFNLGTWPRTGRFTPGKEPRYQLYRRLDGPRGRSGRVRKSLAFTGIRSPDRAALASRYTDGAIPAALRTGRKGAFFFFFFFFVRGPRSWCYGRTAALRLIVQPLWWGWAVFYQVVQVMEHQRNEIDRGKPTTRRKTCPSATLSTTNLTWTWPGIEPGPPWWYLQHDNESGTTGLDWPRIG
jgi:hypothetical protein